MFLVLLTLIVVISASRAPEVQSPEIPETKHWCPDPRLGSPTRTTGECICKFDCEGPKCIRSQGYRFYDWRAGVAKTAKCTLPSSISDAERDDEAVRRAEEKARFARTRQESMINAEQAQQVADNRRAELESLGEITWTEWFEDLNWTNVAVAGIATLCFGSVLAGMVFFNLQSARDSLTKATNASSTATVITSTKDEKSD